MTTEHRDIVPATGPKCPSQAFADLDTTQWYHEYTDYVIGNNLMNGMGNHRFAPNGTTTRAMLVTTLYRLADSPKSAKVLPSPMLRKAHGMPTP